jgi:hypothetical protein
MARTTAGDTRESVPACRIGRAVVHHGSLGERSSHAVIVLSGDGRRDALVDHRGGLHRDAPTASSR